MRTRRRVKWICSTGALICALGCGDSAPTDTGYSGTWTRGRESSRSVISIVHNEQGAWFTWNQWTDNGEWVVECDGWTGSCKQFERGEETGSFQFELWEDPESGHLMLRCDSRFYRPNEPEVEMYYIDELVVQEGGLQLAAFTVEIQGATHEGENRPKRFYDKVTDDVPQPGPAAVGS